VIESTAAVHFEADARQRYARASGASAAELDVEFLARNANHSTTWSDVWETRHPEGDLNDVNGRILNALDMHTHMCILDDSAASTSYFATPAARQAKMDEVKAALPGHELDWPSKACLRARRATDATVGEAVQRACCWEGAAKDLACANAYAETGRCVYPCHSGAGTGGCGYAPDAVYEQPCAGTMHKCDGLMKAACTGVNRRSRACEHFADFVAGGAAQLDGAMRAHCNEDVSFPLAYTGLASSSAGCVGLGDEAADASTRLPPPLPGICGKRALLSAVDLEGGVAPVTPVNPRDSPHWSGWVTGIAVLMAVLIGVALLTGLVGVRLELARRRRRDGAIQELISGVGDNDTRAAMQIDELQKQRTADTRTYNAYA